MRGMRRGFTILEVIVASLCMAVLLFAARSFTGTTRGLSRQRAVQMTALVELSSLLELLSGEPVVELARLPGAPAGPLPAQWREVLEAASPLEAWLARRGAGAVNRKAVLSQLASPSALKRFAYFEPDVDGHAGLHRINVEVMYTSSPDGAWGSVKASRLIARQL